MLVAFSITPIGTGSTSVSGEVADAVRIVRASGLPNRTDAMFTSVEGDWDAVMAVVKEAVLAVAAHSGRASLVLKADYRTDLDGGTLEGGAMEAKVRSLEAHLEG